MRRSHRLACVAALALMACSEDDPTETDTDPVNEPETTETVDPVDPNLSAAPEAEGGWSGHGAGLDNSRYNAQEYLLTVDNVNQLVPRWRIDVDEGVTATPVVQNGIVYFTDWGGTLHAVDWWDGTEKWTATYDDGGIAHPRGTLTVTENALYVADVDDLIKFDLDGNEQWRTRVNDHPTTLIDSSPVVVDGIVILGISGFELTYDYDNNEYFFRGAIAGYNEADGAEAWRFYVTENDDTAGAGVSVWSTAAVDTERKLLFIGTGNTYEEPAAPMSDSVVALNYETGEYAWHHNWTEGDIYTNTKMGPGQDHDIGASPNLFTAGGVDVVGVADKGGTYRAVNRDTGDEVWATELAAGSALGGSMSTAAVDENYVYVNCNQWLFYGFIFGNGHNAADVSVTYALERDTGNIAWETQMPAPTFGALTVANGVVYQPTIPGFVYALDASTGEIIWEHELGRDAAGGIAIADGTAFIPEGFEFFLPATNPGAALTAFGLEGSTTQRDKTGTAVEPSFTVDECKAETVTGQSEECRSCLCDCNATATGVCSEVCWEAATSCAFAQCGDDADISACVQKRCNTKLVPARQRDAMGGVTECRDDCAAACGL